MKRKDWINIGLASPLMIGGMLGCGAWGILTGMASLVVNFGTIDVWAVVEVALGAWFLSAGISTLRVYRHNRTWLEAARVFRKTVRGLPGPPTLYVNDELGLTFLHLAGRNLLFRWDALLRASSDEIGAMMRMLEDGEKVTFIVDEFEIRSGLAMVTKSAQGNRLKLNDEGEPDHADGEPLKIKMVRGMRNRYEALATGLLQANELELNEVLAQLAGARPTAPEAGDT